MNITFYRNQSDRKRINKSISVVKLADGSETLTGVHIKEPCSIMHPKIEISREIFQQNADALLSVNYAHLPSLGRYYFIDDMELNNDGLLIYSLTVDVLYTYRTDLMNTQVLAIRSEKENTSVYTDPEYAIKSNKLYEYEILGSVPDLASAENNNYVMTVAGGAVSLGG